MGMNRRMRTGLTLGLLSLLLVGSTAAAARISVLGFTREEAGVFRVRADGTRLNRLSDGKRDLAPDFSPDGSKVAFLHDISDGDLLVVANADGSGRKEIAYTDSWNATCFS